MPNPTGGMTASVGFFGKLAGAGDFVQRRLPGDFVERWDRHFEHAVAASRERLGAGWQERWFASPAWRFVLAPGVCGDSAWAGVMAPAADRVGRCFPMVMAAPLGRDPAACTRTLREAQRWFDVLEVAHAEARRQAWGADAFDARLAALPGPQEVIRSDPSAALAGIDWRGAAQWRMPLRVHGHDERFLELLWSQLAASGPSWCLWWTHGAAMVPASAMATQGLPAPSGFAAFLDAGQDGEGWRTLRSFAPGANAGAAATPAPAAPAPAPAMMPPQPPPGAPAHVDADTTASRVLASATAPVPDDVTVPGFARGTPEAAPAPAPAVELESPASATAPARCAVYRSMDGALTVLAADDGAHDARCCAAATAQAVAASMAPGEFSGGMHLLRERLLARHPALQASSEDLIDPVMEDAAVVALHTTGRWAAVLRMGTAEVWQWRRGQMRPVFAGDAASAGAGVDTLLGARRGAVAVGLGGSGAPESEDIVCAVEPGDRFLLLATRRLMGLDQALLAQALAMPDPSHARALIAQAAALGTDPAPWPLAVIEVAA
ncbi:type VI secretion system-associated protein TagF [Dyella lutea]|uniref:Type VI secretion system-associated protein TagF n=1 Tax=Dyella lutea TaxID=2950441 RepID=A0ABT1FB49_9GAMM|nr:type VI secretion system-associated protein TagF [Dyella lutea]MCP1374587.1 type VI secretion system-associated protein TagF [Dyella lutea]